VERRAALSGLGLLMTQDRVIDLVIEARHRNLGGHEIRRLLPSRARQRIGPFIFLDHIGPEALEPGRGVDVPPHPHIHLATVTYLFEGDLVHRDSGGSVETIRPGEINWMHAGSGIVHSERTGPQARARESRIHGVQLWVALPAKGEETPPWFRHYAADELPVWQGEGAYARVLVGEAFGLRSPVETASPTILVDLTLERQGRVALPPAPERGLYVVDGFASLGGRQLEGGQLAVLDPGASFLMAQTDLRCLILGGGALEGERHMWWNFVSSSAERIDRAKRDWAEGRFPRVPGDDDVSPLPA
jgi:redox-sensitive bicupin YhaK (pirin superfamily)